MDRWASKRHPSIRRHVATTSPTPTSTRFAASPSGTNESTAATGTADCGSLGLEASPQHPAARGDHVADTDEHEVRSIAERHERIDRSDGNRGLWIVGPRSVTPASGGTWRPRRRHRRARGSQHRRAARTNRPQRRGPRTVDRWASKRHPSIRRHVATTSPTPTSTRFAASPSGTNESTAATRAMGPVNPPSTSAVTTPSPTPPE